MPAFHVTRDILAVALGGAVGSVARWGVGLALQKFAPSSTFPWAILIVNVAGCLLIGALGEWFAIQHQLPAWLRMLLVTGFLGGLTTFSSFGFDSYALFESQRPGLALANIGANVVLGLVGVGIGVFIVRQLS